jgi:hypothetical protein
MVNVRNYQPLNLILIKIVVFRSQNISLFWQLFLLNFLILQKVLQTCTRRQNGIPHRSSPILNI